MSLKRLYVILKAGFGILYNISEQFAHLLFLKI
jgi:hypothetical protein